jgi:predicted amidohydrolase
VSNTTRSSGELLVALAQIATSPAQFTHNLARHTDMVERAVAAHADLVVFPELSLSGYLLAHGVAELSFRLDDERLAPLRELSRRIAIVIGVPLREGAGGISNAALLLEDGEVKGVHRKLYLPTYGMFDEGRYFVPGAALAPLSCSLGTFGVLICEDAWHLSTSVILAQQGVDALIMIAGGPTELDLGGEPAGARRWQWIVGATAITAVTPVFFANRCGWEEGILFGGGSCAVDGHGRELAAAAPALDETLVLATLSRAAAAHARTFTPIAAAERFDLWRALLEKRHA